MIRVYGYSQSRSTRVVWALEEAGGEYEYQSVDIMAGEGRSRAYREVNPGGKVPALRTDSGELLTESGSILLWIAAHFPEAGLGAKSSETQQAKLQSWLFFLITELEQPLWTMAKHRFALPERYRVRAVLDTARYEFSIAANILAQRLGDHPYLLDEHFTVADIVAAHTLSWARAAKAPLEHDNLSSYADRLLARPALRRAREREEMARNAARANKQPDT